MNSPSEASLPDQGTIPAEVYRVLSEAQKVPVADIRPDMGLEADLGVDSFAMIQISVALEGALGFVAPEGDRLGPLSIVTVEDLVELVTREIARQTEHSG